MQFTPVEDFWSEELKSAYCVGLSYRARPQDAKLLELIPQWIREGKVRPGAPDEEPAAAQFSGNGEVK